MALTPADIEWLRNQAVEIAARASDCIHLGIGRCGKVARDALSQTAAMGTKE